MGQVTAEGAESVSVAVLNVRKWTGHFINAPANPQCRRHRQPRHRLSATAPVKLSVHSRHTFDNSRPVCHSLVHSMTLSTEVTCKMQKGLQPGTCMVKVNCCLHE